MNMKTEKYDPRLLEILKTKCKTMNNLLNDINLDEEEKIENDNFEEITYECKKMLKHLRLLVKKVENCPKIKYVDCKCSRHISQIHIHLIVNGNPIVIEFLNELSTTNVPKVIENIKTEENVLEEKDSERNKISKKSKIPILNKNQVKINNSFFEKLTAKLNSFKTQSNDSEYSSKKSVPQFENDSKKSNVTQNSKMKSYKDGIKTKQNDSESLYKISSSILNMVSQRNKEIDSCKESLKNESLLGKLITTYSLQSDNLLQNDKKSETEKNSNSLNCNKTLLTTIKNRLKRNHEDKNEEIIEHVDVTDKKSNCETISCAQIDPYSPSLNSLPLSLVENTCDCYDKFPYYPKKSSNIIEKSPDRRQDCVCPAENKRNAVTRKSNVKKRKSKVRFQDDKNGFFERIVHHIKCICKYLFRGKTKN